MMKIEDGLLRPSKKDRMILIASGFVFLFLIAAVDLMTGPEIAFSVFYLAPISLVVWSAGRGLGILASLTGAALWVLADVAAGQQYSHFLLPYWNGAVRLGFFLVVTFLMSSFKAALEREKWTVAREQRRMFVVLMEQLYTPIAGILGNASLLAREDLPPAAKLCVSEIRQFAEQIQSILLQLKELEPAPGPPVFASRIPMAGK
ncbi:MAG: HAMP domain-containing histidine kinase [Acidobacteria bacterium]|nr:HAMP domain-containing histidine kinase [Acidobacteriota bacterium]